MENNICRFVERGRDAYRIDILYYVLETKPQTFNGYKVNAFYTMYLAVSGHAVLYTANGKQNIAPGDIFFSLPASPYAIEGDTEFRYIYISYMGPRANALMDLMKINPQNCVFSGHDDVLPLWETGLNVADEIVAMRSESILLYTLSEIAMERINDNKRKAHTGDTAYLIKKYLDENYAEPELTLETAGERFSYNPKYISAIFKEQFNVNFSSYLNSLRIQHACALMEQGFSSVKDIAQLCGFKDSMYFSRVFKKRTGMSPREYCVSIKRSGGSL